jgi:hypothetical protein
MAITGVDFPRVVRKRDIRRSRPKVARRRGRKYGLVDRWALRTPDARNLRREADAHVAVTRSVEAVGENTIRWAADVDGNIGATSHRHTCIPEHPTDQA